MDTISEEILGYHILGKQADPLLHEAVVAMHSRGTINPICKSIHAHPALSEAVKKAAKAVADRYSLQASEIEMI